MGNFLVNRFLYRINLWKDDCFSPTHTLQKVDAILSVNWLYHVSKASMEHFLETYIGSLSKGGYIFCDTIDSRYNNYPDNQYHTSDLNLPEYQRRPSEYTFRMSHDDMHRITKKMRFSIIKFAAAFGKIPRTVWILQKN